MRAGEEAEQVLRQRFTARLLLVSCALVVGLGLGKAIGGLHLPLSAGGLAD